ncbi:MAG: SMP-30/gluconolactonase/LRE family protein [Planctomycetota bacterium]
MSAHLTEYRRTALAAIVSVATVAPPIMAQSSPNDRLYITDSAAKEVQRFRKNGASRTVVLDSTFVVGDGLALDADAGMIYWTDHVNRQLVQLHVETSTLTSVMCFDLVEPAGVVVDADADVAYLVDRGSRTIWSVATDGTQSIPIITEGLDAPRDVALHAPLQRIYWTDDALGVFTATVRGGDMQQLGAGIVTNPRAIAIDVALDAAYVATANQLWAVPLDGHGPELMLTLESGHTFAGGLDFDPVQRRLIWNQATTRGSTFVRTFDLASAFLESIATGEQGRHVAIDSNTGDVFWIDGLALRWTAGKQTNDLYVSKLVTPSAMVIDLEGDAIYWSSGKQIRRSTLAGEDELVFQSVDLVPRAMAVDTTARQLYWVEGAATIRYAPLAGGIATTLQTYGLVSVNDLVIDGANAFVVDSALDQLLRVDLETGIAYAIHAIVGSAAPTAIDIDRTTGFLYWADPSRSEIWRVQSDGTLPELLITDPAGPDDVAIDEDDGAVYWTTFNPPAVRAIQLDGSDLQTVPLPSEAEPRTIVLGPLPMGEIPGDITANGAVNIDDVLKLINDFGPCPCNDECRSDVNDSRVVNIDDLVQMIQDLTSSS